MATEQQIDLVAADLTQELKHVCEIGSAKGMKPMIRRIAPDFNYLVLVSEGRSQDLSILAETIAEICGNGVLTSEVECRQAVQIAVNQVANDLKLEEMLLDTD